MRKITREACQAFECQRDFKRGNTEVVRFINNEVNMEYRLHGNLIAYSNSKGLFISNAGWFTNTTKERLNGLTGVNIHQKDYVWYLNGEAWNGKWIKIGIENLLR